MRLSHICLIFAAALFLASTACAQTINTDASIFEATSHTDWATLFITFLFQGGSLPSTLPFAGDHMTSIAQAMRHAMSIYSLAMLVVAAFLLFYHIAAMVAETAHHGVVMGKRANQIWAPIRLITAVVLLIPVGSGLSIGQHIILKIASSGSNVASHMWKTVTNSLSEHFFSLAPPHNPDLSHFIVSSIEMETCRNMYEQIRTSQANDAGVRLAGSMVGLEKNPSTNLVPETWRYTNVLNDAEPMCGEYRFSGYRPHILGSPLYTDMMGHISSDISIFSHAEADNSLTQAKTISLYIAPSFITEGQVSSSDIQANLLTLRRSLQEQIDARLSNLAAAQTSLFGKYLEQSDEAGWITAAFFIPDLVRLQESYGEVVDHILPDVQEPVFVHRALTQQVLFDALASEPAFHNMDHSVVDNLSLFYGKVSRANAHLHSWLYNTEINDLGLSSSGFDLRDQINPATDAAAAFTLFSHSIDTAAITYGVWGASNQTSDPGNPFSSSTSGTSNPLTSLIEFGRRQLNLGIYLIGLASSAMSVPQILAPSLLTALLGICFILGGIGLIFLIPLLPFVRFLLAILAWLVELLEALIAMPLVAIAHLTVSGEGLSGSAARQAYLLWIALAIRPILSIMGLVAGALIFTLGLFILLMALTPLINLSSLNNSGILLIANVGLILTYDIFAYIIANAAFRGINQLPEQALRWISPFVMTESAENAVPSQPAQPSIISVSPSPVTALLEKMTGFSSNQSQTRQDSLPSAKRTGHSSLFPLYNNTADKTSSEKNTAEHDVSAAKAVLSGDASVKGEIRLPPVEKKDKTKPPPQTPYHPNKDKPKA